MRERSAAKSAGYGRLCGACGTYPGRAEDPEQRRGDAGKALKNLKNGIIKEQWGGDVVNYIDNLLKDLQKKSRQRKSTLQWLGNLSSKYAGAC